MVKMRQQSKTAVTDSHRELVPRVCSTWPPLACVSDAHVGHSRSEQALGTDGFEPWRYLDSSFKEGYEVRVIR